MNVKRYDDVRRHVCIADDRRQLNINTNTICILYHNPIEKTQKSKRCTTLRYKLAYNTCK